MIPPAAIPPGRAASRADGDAAAMGTPVLTRPGGATPFTDESIALPGKVTTKDGKVNLDVQSGKLAGYEVLKPIGNVV